MEVLKSEFRGARREFDLPSFRKEVLSSKTPTPVQVPVGGTSHGDTDLVDHMVSGFDLHGQVGKV